MPQSPVICSTICNNFALIWESFAKILLINNKFRTSLGEFMNIKTAFKRNVYVKSGENKLNVSWFDTKWWHFEMTFMAKNSVSYHILYSYFKEVGIL